MNMEVICETGPTAYHPYPRRLESLTISDVITKAALFPQLFKDPECWSGRSRTHDLPHGIPLLNQLSHQFEFRSRLDFSGSFRKRESWFITITAMITFTLNYKTAVSIVGSFGD